MLLSAPQNGTLFNLHLVRNIGCHGRVQFNPIR